MKFVVIATLLISFSSQARNERPLRKIIATHTCEMKIVHSPVIFAKEKIRTLSKGLIFATNEWSPELRRLKVNRTMKIHAVTAKHILMDDSSIASVCVLNQMTRKCDTGMNALTIREIEEKSGQNVKIDCQKDPFTDI